MQKLWPSVFEPQRWTALKLWRTGSGYRCELCGDPTVTPICLACLAELPLLEAQCSRCAEPLSNSAIELCGRCLKRTPSYERVHAPYLYADPIRTLIVDFKYRQRLHLAQVLGWLLQLSADALLTDLPTLIVPVPLHSTRLRERGFNQALELARPLARHLGVRCDYRLALRTHHSAPQATLSAKKRQQNVKNLFLVKHALKGQRVLIIDDVVTTGATVESLSHVLKQAGAETVRVLALTRAAS